MRGIAWRKRKENPRTTRKTSTPFSFRQCVICGEQTLFRFNTTIGHSECSKCGCRISTRGDD